MEFQQILTLPAAKSGGLSFHYYGNTPETTLTGLASDSAWAVRQIVAENPATTVNILRILAYDKDTQIIELAIQHENVNEYFLRYITAHHPL